MKKTPNISQAATQIKPALIHKFHDRLARWYEENGRHSLPWRNTDDPYHIWLSEIMLQQTQVKTVLEKYYTPFLTQFPTIETLAQAPLEKVLKAWEGLGYYNRARNLHKASQIIVNSEWWAVDSNRSFNHNGYFQQLLSLPGIGQNTAHAIMAFAYHAPYAVMEANVKRIIARIFALKTPKPSEYWNYAAQLLNTESPFDYNQAMMDLGAMVCTPKAPDCAICPASHLCQGKTVPETFPEAKKRKAVPTRKAYVLVKTDTQNRIALEQRESALLGGLYGFKQQEETIHISPEATYLGQVRHTYTHFKLEVAVWWQAAYSGHNQLYSLDEIAQMPLSTLDHKILALIKSQTQLVR